MFSGPMPDQYYRIFQNNLQEEAHFLGRGCHQQKQCQYCKNGGLEWRLESNHLDPRGRKNKGKRFGISLCQTSQQMAQGPDSACKDIFLAWGEHWPVSNWPVPTSCCKREMVQICIWSGQLEQHCNNMSISVWLHNTWLGIKIAFRI